MKSFRAGRTRRNLQSASKASSFHRSLRTGFEPLEQRCLLAVTSVGAGAPVLVSFYDSGATASTTFTAHSTNSAITATVLNTSKLLRMQVQTYDSEGEEAALGEMDFLLLDDYAPKNIAHFTELVEQGFYDNYDSSGGLTFHRIIKGFMIQGGDPWGDGTGGSGDDGGPGDIQDDEFNIDLRFTSSGLLAFANSGPDMNDCQFFITSDAERGLDYKHTIFGKLVAGDDMRKVIENVAVEDNGGGEVSYPLYPPQIVSCEVVANTQYGLVMLKAASNATANLTSTITVSASNASSVKIVDSTGSMQTSLSVKTVKDTPSLVDRPAFLLPLDEIHTSENRPVSVRITTVAGDSGVSLWYDGWCWDADGNYLANPAVSIISGDTTGATVTITPSNGVIGVFDAQIFVWRAGLTPINDDGKWTGVHDSQHVALYVAPEAPGFLTSPNVSDNGSVEQGTKVKIHVSGLTDGLTAQLYVDNSTTPIGSVLVGGTGADFTVDTSLLSRGSHTFTAKQVCNYDETIVGNTIIPAGKLYSESSASIFHFNIVERPVPVARLDTTSLNIANGTTSFSIVYTQPSDGIDAATVDGNDVLVTGPNSYRSLASLVGYVLNDSGTSATATYRVTAPSGVWQSADAGSYLLAMQSGQVADKSGAFVAAGTLGGFTIGDLAPTVTINQASGQADPTNGTIINFTVVFSTPVTGFTADDLVISGTATGTASVSVSSSSETQSIYETTYNVSVMGIANGTVIVAVAAGAATDAQGRLSKASASNDNSVTSDTVPPTVMLTHDTNQADPTSDSELIFKAVFSEPVVNFTTDKITVTSDLGASVARITDDGNNTYTIAVRGMKRSGAVTVTLAAAAAKDSAGNTSVGPVTATANYVLPAPTVTISQTSGQADPTNQSEIHFTVVFNGPVSDFTGSDVRIGGTAPNAHVVSMTGSGTTYDVVVGGMTGSGTIIVSIPAGVVTNADGTANKASLGGDHTVTYDTVSPAVTINQAPGQKDPANTSPVSFLVKFSETVTDFSAADVIISGSAAGNLYATTTGSGKSYYVKVHGMTSSGTVSVNVPAGIAHDKAGNANLASMNTDNTVYYDIARPDVVISRAAGQTASSNASVLYFTAIFSEPVVDFTADDLTLSGSAPGAITAIVTGSGTTYDIAVRGMTGNGSVMVSLPAGRVHDSVGSSNTTATGSSRSVTYDNTAPTVTINQYTSQADPTSQTSIDFYIRFSEAVIGLTADDLVFGGTAPGNLTAKITGTGTTYHALVSGMTGSGTVTAAVKAGAAIDNAGNANVASTSTDNSVQFVAPAKSFTLTSPTSGNYTLGSTMLIRWKAEGALAGSTINLCLDADKTWSNGNEHWITMNQLTASNGSDTYTWNVSGISAGSYYVSGYMYSGNTPVFSRSNTLITINKAAPATFSLTSPTSGSYGVGQSIPIAWTAGKTVSGSVVSLCYDIDTVFNGNEKWIEIDQVSAKNGTGSYVWNTAGVKSGKYYIAGYVYSGGQATFSHLSQPITLVGSSFSIANLAGGTYTAGQSINITSTAGNIASGAKISLCYDADATWNGNEKWIEIDQLTAVNGSNTYKWDTTSVAPGTYYVAGYLWSGGQPTFSHSAQKLTIAASPFVLTASTVQGVGSGQNVPIQWNVASTVPAGSTISLCYDTDTLWNGNEQWITIDKITASKGNGSYTWNTAGVAAGTYYLAGYLYDGKGGFSLSRTSQAITIGSTFSLNNPATTSYTVGQNVTIGWLADNTPTGGLISLCYDSDSSWNGNEKWIEIDKVAATNGGGLYTWNTTGVTPATYYLAGYLYDGKGGFTLSRASQPITISAALTVDASATPAATPTLLSEEALAPVAAEAARRWTAALGVDAGSLLAGVRLELADLQPGRLGEASGNTIRIDRDAAGYGWFVDATPTDDSEFAYSATAQTLKATTDSPAAQHADLLTAVMHEMGHLLGYEDDAAGDLMDATLQLGTRRTSVVDELFATLRD